MLFIAFYLLDPIFCFKSILIWWLPWPHVPSSYFKLRLCCGIGG